MNRLLTDEEIIKSPASYDSRVAEPVLQAQDFKTLKAIGVELDKVLKTPELYSVTQLKAIIDQLKQGKMPREE